MYSGTLYIGKQILAVSAGDEYHQSQRFWHLLFSLLVYPSGSHILISFYVYYKMTLHMMSIYFRVFMRRALHHINQLILVKWLSKIILLNLKKTQQN